MPRCGAEDKNQFCLASEGGLFLSSGEVHLLLPPCFHFLCPTLAFLQVVGPGLSRKRLSTLAKKRLVHVLVIILDYLFLGRFPTVEELGRQPSPEQRRCLQRLFTFATACGSRSEEFPVAPGALRS